MTAVKLDPFRTLVNVHWREPNTEPVTEPVSESPSEPVTEPPRIWYWYAGDAFGSCPGTRPITAGSARGPFGTREEAEEWLLDHTEYGGSSFPCPATPTEANFLTCVCLAWVSETDPDVLELVESAGYLETEFGPGGCYNSGVLCETPTE